MGKVLIGVAAGIFVGALGVEILNRKKRRKKPGLTRKLRKMANNAVDRVAAAFK